MEIIKDALHYARIGWHVLPLNGKIPLTAHGVKEATTDEKQIKEWFSIPGRNIGVATGAISKITVLDFDGKDGLETEKGLGLRRNEHTCQKTGKGHHYVFNYTPMRSHVRILKGVDVRSDGSYIVVYPSVHPDTRRMYEWVSLEGPRDIPESIIRRIKMVSGTRGKRPINIDTVREGARNDTLARLMGVLKSIENDKLAFQFLLGFNQRFCVPPLSEVEVETVFQSLRGR